MVAAGPGIKSGETLYGATLLDITPTLLSLLGLPIGNDMDGRPWLEIFDRKVQPARIESWETVPGDDGQHAVELREDPVEAAAMIGQLVELGYVAAPDEDAEKTVQAVLRDHKINLAVALTSVAAPRVHSHSGSNSPSNTLTNKGFSCSSRHAMERLGAPRNVSRRWNKSQNHSAAHRLCG